MIQPLAISSKLAGTPTREPQFKTSLRLKNGETIAVADPQATRALIALMDMAAVLGGAASHYGGPAAMAELMSSLHGIMFHEAREKSKPWNELFHFVNDAGHCENGLYALKANYGMAGLELDHLKKFRSLESNLTGHGEAHLFPEGVMISNGPLGSAFPQSQGLAMGDSLAGRDRVTIAVLSDGGSMEGEAREAFAAIPGLAQKGQLAPYVLIISDNNTKLSGRIDQESFSMEPTFEALDALGWHRIRVENGHDLQACATALSQAFEAARANPRIPVVVHAKTIKGIGTKKTAESASGGHGFPLKSPSELPDFLTEIYGGQYPTLFDSWIADLKAWESEIKALGKKDSGEKIQKGVAAALIRARKEGLPVVSVTSDLPGSTGVADFRKAFPEGSIDVGIAESNMISAAAGLSKLGFVPVVDTFAQFGVTKGALPLTMASLSEAPVIAIFSHTGFQDAADGASHQALSYLSMVGSIPHVDCYALTCSEEAEALVYQAVRHFSDERLAGRTPHSVVFFLGRENFPKAFQEGASYQLGRSQIVKDTSGQFARSVAVVAPGSMIPQGLEVVDALAQKGMGVILVNPAVLNRFDLPFWKDIVKRTSGRLVTVEDHQLLHGYGASLAHQLVLNGLSIQMRSLGVEGHFGQSAYNAIDLYRKHRLDSSAIMGAVASLMEGVKA